ncbi:NAD(P)-dependent alcohol dehydrogenase [Bradyrhizobium sp. U87765 SZCCT0131]|uniref:zinc-dependent alcohol dehydrogenase family protein n=1 Tax=unclassified Bradyrhizobium TaxID=2631580 RepID=UPI001BA4AA53|nr:MULTISPECIES: NAD(P)-dependent alcohol dehydrogenase [unclassified Bradyrhizobium]MBR1219456.1 NAD(P)-dependent alcohol dehydrogenase [Bradyrhizobium sp. U87765 SZCCT0131]MBR1262107.1 NAD(P)-dependent alcohol dehydrogenase [Bradyrhizobium sp. U87765 SZCCT0134]MBR1306040.1 NAD(P)-dependent alcohol dehydrogenase [Bradyrhizobium sp. U87765 SZCCT0110]MBR1317889.1 NAD(P)-dependent alcohol dehydrogenase [Bradyrhizobium sp. U87765 SZCCT0109]MBR1351591.1 NAD(P)-dependent alcohol dehydrogenase [Brad
MKLYRLTRHADGARATLTDAPLPEPKAGEVRVRIAAASLNYRDLLVRDGVAKGNGEGRIPLSDAAGEVDAVGVNVHRLAVGDRVAASFFRDWTDGPFHARYMNAALGGSLTDGVLAEHVVLPEHAWVRLPDTLDAMAAATLPCAAVTAWHALVVRGGLRAGDTVLVQGTGGVALFGLQFAVALGARVIVLSSSDDKLARARALGATDLVNYRTTPEWDAAVLELTGGAGVSHVLELGGPQTYQRALNVIGAGGRIAQIGVLTGFGPQPNLARLQGMNADILGITVGSRAHFENMLGFIAEHRITPVIDRVFAFDDVENAYAHLRAATHVGKVVIRVRA